MLLVAGSTPDDRQRLGVNEEGIADRLLLRYCRRQPLASTSTLAYGWPQCWRPPQTETHHEPAGPERPPPLAMVIYEISASRAPARPDNVCPTLLFLR
jgi:hypothetical protein